MDIDFSRITSDEVALKQALMYRDSRCHFVYSDNTGLILHPGAQCFTYFDKSGTKTRFLSRFAINSGARENSRGTLNKLLVALRWHNIHAAEPAFARED